MVLPTEVTIKEEKEDFEADFSQDLMPEGPGYDVTVKIEAGTDLNIENVENEWLKQEVFFDDDFECESNSTDGGLCYEDLIDYCEQRCPICFEKFWESYSLLRHNLKHLKLQLSPLNKETQCKTCLQYFIDTHSLNKHIYETHKDENGRQIENDDTKIMVTKMLHQCEICGKILNYKNWHAHMKEVHGPKLYICSICDSSFTCRRYLRVHMQHVHIKTLRIEKKKALSPHPCSLCSAVLECKDALKTHVRNCHSEKVRCKICNSLLKSKSYLHSHMLRVHYDDGKEHKCKCGKVFKSPRYLRVHIKNSRVSKKKKEHGVL